MDEKKTAVKKELGMSFREVAELFEQEFGLIISRMARGLLRMHDASMRNGSVCTFGDHSERVSDYAFVLAQNMGWPKDACVRVAKAGFFHDTGKMGIPEKVLNYPGRLSDDLWSRYIVKHPTAGVQLLVLADVFGNPLIRGVRDHHENFRGGGYPGGLVGNAISDDGRVLRLADCFDSMTTSRPYEDAPKTPEQGAAELREDPYGQFDPYMREAAAECFPDVFRRLRASGLTGEREYRDNLLS